MTDASLRDSGMEWTILAPDAFAEVWIPIVVAGPVLEGREILHVGSGMRRHSFVSVADVAAFAHGRTASTVSSTPRPGRGRSVSG
jgi:uncharacterized protein YbjT (DUF2867 family)